MFKAVGIVLLGAILGCLGLIVKWEFKRAKRGPRFDPKVLRTKTDHGQEGTGAVYVPPGGGKRAFELGRRRS